jgi:dipeptidase E
LLLVREKPSKKEIEKKIFSADIVYVGGGNTLRMLRIWRKFGVDVLLRKAHRQGVALAGLSAGAICWFRYGSSDARRFQGHAGNVSYMRVSGLGMIRLTVSPHHIREKSRSGGLERMMRRTPGVALALDDNAAIFIEDGYYRIVRS